MTVLVADVVAEVTADVVLKKVYRPKPSSQLLLTIVVNQFSLVRQIGITIDSCNHRDIEAE